MNRSRALELLAHSKPTLAERYGVVRLTQARAKLSELADQAKAGTGKIITKNGESYVASIDAERLDYCHRLEREHIPLLREEIDKGLADAEAGGTRDAREALVDLKRAAQRSPAAAGSR